MKNAIGFVTIIVCYSAVQLFAAPLDYTVSFFPDALSGEDVPNILPTSGSFTYDSALASDPFSNFTVVWNGETLTLTNSANAPSINIPGGAACINGTTGGAAAFLLLTNCPDAEWWVGEATGGTSTDFFFVEPAPGGTWLVAFGTDTANGTYYSASGGGFSLQQEAPEPATAVVSLIGLSLLLGIRKSKMGRRVRLSKG